MSDTPFPSHSHSLSPSISPVQTTTPTPSPSPTPPAYPTPSTNDPFTGYPLPYPSPSPGDDESGISKNASYFLGFLITFIVLLVLFAGCGFVSQRQVRARRRALAARGIHVGPGLRALRAAEKQQRPVWVERWVDEKDVLGEGSGSSFEKVGEAAGEWETLKPLAMSIVRTSDIPSSSINTKDIEMPVPATPHSQPHPLSRPHPRSRLQRESIFAPLTLPSWITQLGTHKEPHPELELDFGTRTTNSASSSDTQSISTNAGVVSAVGTGGGRQPPTVTGGIETAPAPATVSTESAILEVPREAAPTPSPPTLSANASRSASPSPTPKTPVVSDAVDTEAEAEAHVAVLILMPSRRPASRSRPPSPPEHVEADLEAQVQELRPEEHGQHEHDQSLPSYEYQIGVARVPVAGDIATPASVSVGAEGKQA